MENIRKRKSINMSAEEKREFKKYVNGFVTKLDCAEDLGINRHTLDAILEKWRCSPDTLNLIRNKINVAA